MSKPQASKRKRHWYKSVSRERKDREKKIKCSKTRARRMCLRKVRHETREGAESSAAFFSNRSGMTIGIYHCPLCGGWHLTHKI